MTTPLIVGNWKMNTMLDDAVKLARATASASDSAGERVDVGICPPFPWIVPVSHAVRGTTLNVGAQDCADSPNGAHTGDVSATMLAGCCSFTLLGHSERRAHHQETDDIIRAKLRLALDAGLDVILCVGETKEQRDAGSAHNIVRNQLRVALSDLDRGLVGNISIAYEPVWAIGTGDAATEQDAADMATTIREKVGQILPPASGRTRILYGGSANAENAAGYLAADGIDGLLVGGASLSGETFSAMIGVASNHPS